MADDNQQRTGFLQNEREKMSSDGKPELPCSEQDHTNANDSNNFDLVAKGSEIREDTQEIVKNDMEVPAESKNDKQNIPFFKYLTNPLLLLLDDLPGKSNDLIEDIINDFTSESSDVYRKSLSEGIPILLQGCGRGLRETMEHIENLIQFEKYEPDQDRITELVPANLHDVDMVSALSIVGHSLGAYVSILESAHLKHLATRIVTDVSTWVSRIFRYPDGSVHFHEEEREGLVKICQLAMHKKFPRYFTEGYEALRQKPPVLYVSSSAKHNTGQHLCHQIGLPLSSLSVVPCKLGRMDLKALRKFIEGDQASGKTPVMIIACAGTPLLGRCDDLEGLHEIAGCFDLWLHLEGSGLSLLPLPTHPPCLDPAILCNSMTLNLAAWLALPSVPFVTLFRSPDVVLTRTVGLSTFNVRFKLNCISLWLCMISLGYNKILARLQFHFNLAKAIHEKLQTIQIENELVIMDMESPCVIFKYQIKTAATDQSIAEKEKALGAEHGEPFFAPRDPYCDTLNIWLTDMLKNTIPEVHVSVMEVEGAGMCVRYAPLETSIAVNSWSLLEVTREDMDQFLDFLDQHIRIMDATVAMRPEFGEIVACQDNLRLVRLQTWAGLGAVRYIPDGLLSSVDDLSEEGKVEVNALNQQIVQHLKSSDSAFSLGVSESGINCIRFGLVTYDADLEELITFLLKTGKEVEESSKYLETMANIVKRGIEQAAEDLEKENKEKLMQEGLLRQVPLVSSLLNWWSPPPKDIIKGRSFNLASGRIASTEETYRSCMQVLENPSGEVQPAGQKEVALKFTLKKPKRALGSDSDPSAETGSATSAPPRGDVEAPTTSSPGPAGPEDGSLVGAVDGSK